MSDASMLFDIVFGAYNPDTMPDIDELDYVVHASMDSVVQAAGGAVDEDVRLEPF